MATYLMEGHVPPREDSYNITNKGLFVFAFVPDLNITYHTKIDGEVRCEQRFEGYNSLYQGSRDTIRNLFNLNEESENQIEPELCDTHSDAVKALTDEILKKWKKLPDPSFLMVFIMAPSFEFGEFLLGRPEGGSNECCLKNHSLENECFSRRVSRLVSSISEATDDKGKGLAGIPKMFFIHTISGRQPGKIDKVTLGGVDDEKDYADTFIPKGSDTFIMYVHTEESISWLSENKSFYLVTEFCETVKAILKETEKCNQMLKMLNSALSNKPADKEDSSIPSKGPLPPGSTAKQATVDENLLQSTNDLITTRVGNQLHLNPDSLLGSWFDNVCTTTATNITNWLTGIEEQEKEKKGKTVRLDHLRVHMSSTMRRRLSLYDIMKQQFP